MLSNSSVVEDHQHTPNSVVRTSAVEMLILLRCMREPSACGDEKITVVHGGSIEMLAIDPLDLQIGLDKDAARG